MLGYPGRTDFVREQHAAWRVDVLARYALSRSEKTQCAFVGKHRHQNGLIVRLLCKPIVSIGWRCGELRIVNYDALRLHVAKLDRFALDRVTVGGATRLIDAADASVKRAEHLLQAARAMRDRVPFASIGFQMGERRGRGAKGAAIHTVQRFTNPLTGRRRVEEVRTAFLGLCIFDAGVSTTEVREAVTILKDALPREADVHSSGAARITAQASEHLEAKWRPLDKWTRDASTFFTEANLRLVLLACDVKHGVQVDGDSLVGQDGSSTLTLSARGGLRIAAKR